VWRPIGVAPGEDGHHRGARTDARSAMLREVEAGRPKKSTNTPSRRAAFCPSGSRSSARAAAPRGPGAERRACDQLDNRCSGAISRPARRATARRSGRTTIDRGSRQAVRGRQQLQLPRWAVSTSARPCAAMAARRCSRPRGGMPVERDVERAREDPGQLDQRHAEVLQACRAGARGRAASAG